MFHFLISTANYADSVRVSEVVRNALTASSVKENEDYVVLEFSTRDALKEYLDSNNLIQPNNVRTDISKANHTLVIAQPSLTDMEDVRPLLAQLLENADDSVILLRFNNAGLRGLPISPDRILTSLSVSERKRLAEMIDQFLKEHEFFGYHRLIQILDHYKDTRLTPRARPGESSLNGDRTPIDDSHQVEKDWEKLAIRFKQHAERARNRAIEEHNASSEQREQEGQETHSSGLLSLSAVFLRLWVEAQLYKVRAKSNYGVYESAVSGLTRGSPLRLFNRTPPGYGIAQKERAAVEKEIKTIIKAYFKELREFDAYLSANWQSKKYYAKNFGDAEQFREWSELFGPKNVQAAFEPGWDIHAASAGRRLFLEYRKALMAEYSRSPSTWAFAVIFFVYWIVAGFGLQPWRPLVIMVVIYIGSAAAHLGDDLTTARCATLPAPGGWTQFIGYYLGVSTASLTSLGSIATPCGYWHGLISGVESLSGYFLLAILTTLLVQSILER